MARGKVTPPRNVEDVLELDGSHFRSGDSPRRWIKRRETRQANKQEKSTHRVGTAVYLRRRG